MCFFKEFGTNQEPSTSGTPNKIIINYFKSSNCGKVTVYLDRIHQYLCPVKILLRSMQY